MEKTIEQTPLTIEDWQDRCLKLEQQIAELSAKLKWYEEQFRLSQQKKFGASSERTNSDQLQLFNEAEVEANPAQEEPTLETVTIRRKKQRGQRETMIEELPVE
ncbi:transposase, partial [Effusibacillus pohliae]|uniref:transposase n=1 Tax=Effusibacillus pohliae TaxID=232270 RepID=UPI001FDFD892